MSDSELVLYGFCAGFFAAELLMAWCFATHGPKCENPNPFGELPPVQPLGAVFGNESTQYLDLDVVTRRLEPIGIATIAIRHNADLNARN